MGHLRAHRTAGEDDRARTPVRRQPEHGLLALQRAVGNKAVAAIIQRTLIKDASFESDDEKKDAEKAVEQHKAHHALVTEIVNEAEKDNGTDELTVRLANSAKLIKKKVIKLYVLSAPHDQDHPGRVQEGRSTLMRPWIQSPVPGDANSYHKEHDNVENLHHMDGLGVFGVTNAHKEIRILFKPGYTRTREEIEATLRHEVQHVVDFHDQVYSQQKNLRGDTDWITYATEYGAHYFQEARAPGDRVTKAVADGQSAKDWVSQRQFEIFKQIYDNYDVVKKRWDDEEIKLSRGREPYFQKAVLGLVEPTSINPLNSPTLHGLYVMILDDESRITAPALAMQFGRLDDVSDVGYLNAAAATFPVVNGALEKVAKLRLVNSKMRELGVTYTPTEKGRTGS